MPQLKIVKLPAHDVGRLLVRLNVAYRGTGLGRYGIAKITNNKIKKSILVLMLGHDKTNAIYMPVDIRMALGVDKGAELDFEVEKVGLLGKIRWYLSTPDPAVHIPGWIAVVGVVVGLIGVFL